MPEKEGMLRRLSGGAKQIRIRIKSKIKRKERF